MSAKKTNIAKKIKQINKLLSKKNNKRYLYLGTAFLIFATIAYLGKSLILAAIVNGKPIFRFTLVQELEKQGGEQTLDSLITKELIFQKAKEQGVNVSNEQVQEEIQVLSAQVESQGSTLDAALSLQGQTRKTLEENIRLQKTVENLLREEVQVSEEELKQYFEENKSIYGQDAKFDEIKESIKGQLEQERLADEFRKWMQQLKSESQIIYFVNF